MSIMDLFRNIAPVAAPAPAPAAPTPGNIPANAAVTSATANTPATAPNGTVPAAAGNTNEPAKSGLDQFADLFNTDPNAQQQGQPLFNVSHEKMMEAARKQNFTAGIAPELLAKVTAGGAEAAQAMVDIMNIVAQNSYAQSAFAGTRLIEGALDKSNFARQSDIDTRIKTVTVNNNLTQDNPVFAHPAAQPLLKSVQDQLMVKYPNATPTELTQMAQTYLTDFVKAAQGPQLAQEQQQQQKAAAGDDWSKFFA